MSIINFTEHVQAGERPRLRRVSTSWELCSGLRNGLNMLHFCNVFDLFHFFYLFHFLLYIGWLRGT